MFQPLYSYEEQLHQLAQLVDEVHVRKHPRVKGPYTSSDYVTWRLNNILTPTGWSFELLSGPDLIHVDGQKAYIRCTGRLSITLADGQSAFHDDVGVWPMYAAKIGEGGLLDQTAPELYETAIKAAVSDCLKACAERLGATGSVSPVDGSAGLRVVTEGARAVIRPSGTEPLLKTYVEAWTTPRPSTSDREDAGRRLTALADRVAAALTS